MNNHVFSLIEDNTLVALTAYLLCDYVYDKLESVMDYLCALIYTYILHVEGTLILT